MFRLFLYFGLFSTIFCASLELDAVKPEIQSLEKASTEEILSLNKLVLTTPTEKWKNSFIILRTLQLLKSIMSQNMEWQVHMTYILNHLIKIIESNTESFSLEEQNAMDKLLDALENYQGPTLEDNPKPSLRRSGKTIPKRPTRTKTSYCANALLKISQIASDAYNKLTSEKLDYENSKLSNIFEKLALPVAGTGEISPYAQHKQQSKDAINFLMGLDLRKTMNGHGFKYRSAENLGKGTNIQRTRSSNEKNKRIFMTFKRPRTAYFGTKLSQPLYKHLKSYRTTRTSVDKKGSTESTLFDNKKINYGLNVQDNMNNEVTTHNYDDYYPFNIDDFENFEDWNSDDDVVPISGNYYAWESSPTPPNYFPRFSPIKHENHNRESKDVYDSMKKIPVFSKNKEVRNIEAIPDFEFIWNNEHHLDDIYPNSTQAHQDSNKPWKYNAVAVADSSANNHQPIDYERPWAYKIPIGPSLYYDNRIPLNHDQFNEHDKSATVVAPSLYPFVNNRHAHEHVSNFNQFTSSHEGYISIEDLKGPDNDKFWAYDTYLWNMGIELPEIKYDVPSSQVGELSNLMYQPTGPAQDDEFINAFPINLVNPRADFLKYPQVNNPDNHNWNYEDYLLDHDSDQHLSASQNPGQMWNYYPNPSENELTTIDPNRDYYQPYVQNSNHLIPYDQNPSEIETYYDPKKKYSLDNHNSIASHKWLPIPADKLVVVSEYVDQNSDYNWPYNENPSEIDLTTERYIPKNELTDSRFSVFNQNPGHQWPYDQNPDYYQPSQHKPITNYWPYNQPFYPSETEIELTTRKYISVNLNHNHDWPYEQDPDYNWSYNQNSEYNWADDHKPDYYRPYDQNPTGDEININTNNIDSKPSYNVLPKSTVRPILMDESPSYYWSFDLNPSDLNIDDATERVTSIDNFDTNPLYNELPMPIKISKEYVNHKPGYWPYYHTPSEFEIGEIDITPEKPISVDKVINSKLHHVQSYDPDNYWLYYQNSENYWPHDQNPSDNEIAENDIKTTPYDIKWLSPTKRPFIINNNDWHHQNVNYNWQHDQNPDWGYDNSPSEFEIETTTITPINYDINSFFAHNVLPSTTVRSILIKNTSHYWPYKFWPNDQKPSDIEIQPRPNKHQNSDYDWQNPGYNFAYDYNPNYNWTNDHSPEYTDGNDPEYYWYYGPSPDYYLTYDQKPSELETEVTTQSHIPTDVIMDPNLDYYRPNDQNSDLYWLFAQNSLDSEIEITTKRYTIKHNTDSDSIKNWLSVNTNGLFDSDHNLDNYWPYGLNPMPYWTNAQNPLEIETEGKKGYNVDNYPNFNELILSPKWPLPIKNYFTQNPDKHTPSYQNLDYWPYSQNPSEIEGKFSSVNQVINSNLSQDDQNSDFYWPIDQNPSQFEIEMTTKRFVFVDQENDAIPDYNPFYEIENPIPVEAQIDPENMGNKSKEFETTTHNPVASQDKKSLEFDYVVTTKRPPVLTNGHTSNNFVFDRYAWNVNRPSTTKVPPQPWNYNYKQWDFNTIGPTIRPTLNGYKITGNKAFIWDYNQHPETVTANYIVSNEDGLLNHNYQGTIYNSNWNQPNHQISTEGYITIDGLSEPQINQLWTSENLWKPEYYDTQEYNIESFRPGIKITTKIPNDPGIEGGNYFQYNFYETTTMPPTSVTDLYPYQWGYNVQKTTERQFLQYEISDFENSYPKQVTNEVIMPTEVTTPPSPVSIYDFNYLDPTLNFDDDFDESGMSIEQTSSNMMPFGDKQTTSYSQSSNQDFSTDITDNPSWDNDNNVNLTDFIEVPNYDDDYGEIFNTDLSDLEIDDNIETETQVINLIKQKLDEVDKRARKENEIRILTLINKIREIVSGDVNKDKYVEVLTYYNEINSYLNANMDGQSKMVQIINRLYTLPNQKNLEIDTHDHFVEMTYLVRRPKPIIIYPYYYIKYKVPVHKIDELVRKDPNIIDEDDNLHIDLLKTSEIADRSTALSNLSDHDLFSLTIGHGDVIDTKLVGVSRNKTADLYKGLFNRQKKKLRSEEETPNLNKLNEKAIQLTIKQNDKLYDTISIEDRHFPIEEQNGDQLNDLSDPFRKLISLYKLPLYKLNQASDEASFASRRGLNLKPLDILPDNQKNLTNEPINQVIVNMDKDATVTEENNPINTKNKALNSDATINEEQGFINTEKVALSSNPMVNDEHDSDKTINNALKSNTTKNEEQDSVSTEIDALNSNTSRNDEHNFDRTINDALKSITVKNGGEVSVSTENDALKSNTTKNEGHDSVSTKDDALKSNTNKNDENNFVKAINDALKSYTTKTEELTEQDSINMEHSAPSSNKMKNEEQNSVSTENDALNSNTSKNDEHNSDKTINDTLKPNTMKNEEKDSIITENDGLSSNTSISMKNDAADSNHVRNSQSTETEEHNSIKVKNDALNSKTIDIDGDDNNNEHNSSYTRLEGNSSTTVKRDSYVPPDLLIEKNRNLGA